MASDAPREDLLTDLGQQIRSAFERNQRVLSFAEYFALVRAKPRRHTRSIAEYLKDAFDHYGTDELSTPRGRVTRYRLFDMPFDEGRGRLIGQEEVQAQVYRALLNFARDRRVTRLILLHGPNGSAKSTLVSCITRAIEHYSTLDEGALYRFNWIFPSQKISKSGIGFGGTGEGGAPSDSFAHLEDEHIDAKLVDELRDHPLLLLPKERRASLIPEQLGEYLAAGELSHKNRQIFEALLSTYHGDYLKVLRHVQVERFFVSRRYREAAVTIEPQLAVDARSRQLTMDRSLSALPPALQSLSLFEYSGDLVAANRGIIEYADLLKRPLETYKYLLGTVEHAEVNVDGTAILPLDLFFIGSSNEAHLAVFKEIPDFQSFKGRMELVRVPYLVDYRQEGLIYQALLRGQTGDKHVAPHVSFVAALWAVLTRMRKPIAEKYSKSLAEIVTRISPLEKAELYATGKLPEGLSPEQGKELANNVERLYSESDNYPNYEGRSGASPREIKTVLLNATQSADYACVSPFAVFDELDELVKHASIYEFLKQEPLPGGFHENRKFITVVRDRLSDIIDEEIRSSMGLIDEKQYVDLMARYVMHVSHWNKKEKMRNPTTGRLDDPDGELMNEVERRIGVAERKDEFRSEVIARIGAWSIEHPGARPSFEVVFPSEMQSLRDSYFHEQKKHIQKTQQSLLEYLADGAEATRGRMDRETLERVETTLKNLIDRYGYCTRCLKDAVSFVLRRRYG